MIDVTVVYRIRKNDIGFIFSDGPDHSELMFRIVLKESVFQAQVVAHGNAKDLRRFRRLLGAKLGSTPGAQFTAG